MLHPPSRKVRSKRERHGDQEYIDGRVEDETLEGSSIGRVARLAIEVDMRVPSSEQAAVRSRIAIAAGQERCALAVVGR